MREIVETFLDRYPGLFGHTGAALRDARLTREDVTAHNGMSTLVWGQQLDGIPLFKTILKANVSKDGQIITLTDHFLTDPAQAAGQGEAARSSLVQASPVDAAKAISLAAAALGDQVDPAAIVGRGQPEGAEQKQSFTAPKQSDTTAQLAWMPLSANLVRLAWDVTTMSLAQEQMFRTVVDAQTGELLYRASLTNDGTDATYRIFTTESPTPFSPGHEFVSSLQPAQTERVLLTTPALNLTASPNGWINDGNMETNGNNVDAHTDTDNNNVADLPRPNGGASRVFDFALDLTQAPSTYKDASVTQLFYWCNFMHDRMYEMGFTESAGNFQLNNFGRGGAGNDPVQADAQDGSGTNNANFSTPADGSSGRMQMFLWTGPTPDRDGSFEAEVVLHEYGHGVSNRLVGGGVGISALASKGMGEGWSDFFGLALTAEASDNPHGNWARAGYSRYQTSSWYSENHYFGARRYSYSTDMLKNPHTLRDIDPSQVSWHTSVPRNPTYAATQDATQVHYMGTVWCTMLWEMRTNLILRHGFATGNDRAIRLVTDGLKLSPVNPNFIQARDAIIQATLVSFPEDTGEVWSAFAKRGAGQDASAPASSTTTGIVESYSVPDDLHINDRSGWNILGDKGGPFAPASKTLSLSNTGSSTLAWSVDTHAAWLNATPSSGTLAAGGSIAVTLTTQADAVVPGFFSTNVVFTNVATSINQPIGVRLYVMAPRVHEFDLESDPGWTRSGEWAFGTPAGGGGTAAGGSGNPDPSAGATGSHVFGVNLAGNHSTSISGPHYLTLGPVSLASVTKTRLRFQRWLNTNALANIRTTVEVSTDGTHWREVFVNGGSAITDNAWTRMDYDISSVADLQATVYVRWGYQTIASPGAYSGWNIDDVELLGEATNNLTISAPGGASEGDAPVSATVTMTLAQPASTEITLTSSNPEAATVPASVTLAANQTSAAFAITPVDDALLDGPQTTVITASAPGLGSGVKTFTVQDNESATLTLSLPASVTEGGAAGTGSVTRSVVTDSPLTVTLNSSAPLAATVPPTVVIPAGTASFDFAISPVNDTAIDGTQSTTISASVANWTGASGTVDVLDDETRNLTVALPVSVTEGSTSTGSVTISGTLTSALVVSLASDNPKLTLPATVTIAAAATSATFTLTAPNDALAEVNTTATVTASAADFTAGSSSTSVIDNDLHHFSFAAISSPKTLNAPFSVTITAMNLSNSTVTAFTGTAGLSGIGASGIVSLTPATTGSFSAGAWTGSIAISTETTNIVLTASDGAGITGTSNAFAVGVGSLHHFAFSNIASPQTSGTAFATTITAKDSANNTVTSFGGTASLSPSTFKTVGTGTSSTTTLPLYTFYHDQRTQCIYLQSEIGVATTIRGLSLNVTTLPGQTLNNWTIRMKHTTQSSYSTASWDSSGWTTVYQANTTINSTGPTSFTFTTPFVYDGVSNLLVDFSFNNSTWTSSGGVTYTTASANRTIYAYTDSGWGDPLTWSGTSSPPPVATTMLPDLVLQTDPPGTSTGSRSIGTGSSSTNILPLYTYYHDQRTQCIYLQSELGTAANIRGLSLNVTTVPGQTMNNWTIRMKHTALSSYATASWDSSGWTTVYQANTTVSTTGPASFVFTTPFAYDGVSNLLVDFSFNNSSFTSAGGVTYTTASANRTIYAYTDSGWGDPLTWSGTSSPPPTVTTLLPNLVLQTGQAPLAVTPASPTFAGGVWSGNVTVNGSAAQLALLAVNGSSSGVSNSFTVNSTVTAYPQSVTVAYNTPTLVTLTGQDAAAPAATLTYAIVTTPSHGVLSGSAPSLTYTPVGGYSGSDSFTFTAANGANISPPATVSLTVQPPPPEIVVEQPAGTGLTDGVTTVDYGTIPTGTGTVRTFTVSNAGTMDLVISGITKDGTNSSDISIGAITSSTIAGGGSATFDVTFTPGAAAARSAAIHVLSNDGDEASFDIPLIAAGTSALPDIAIEYPAGTLRPDAATIIDFGLTASNVPVVRTLTLRNTGTANLTLSGVSIDGTGASQFAAGSLSSWTIAPSSSLTLDVSFLPTAPGAKLAVLHVASNDPDESPFDIELHGIGNIVTGPVSLAKDINAGAAGYTISNFTAGGGSSYYHYSGSLYRTDGTAGGTASLSLAGSTLPGTIAVLGTTVLFAGLDSAGVELWSYNGSTAARLADIYSGTSNSSPGNMTVVGSVVFFTATTSANGTELWKTDGTGPGTVLVKDICPGSSSSSISSLVNVNGTLFFAANDGTNGVELWKSDGTAAGTVMVSNICSGSGSSNPSYLIAVGGIVYFAANNGSSGVELWKSDGTTASQVVDIYPGASSSSPASLLNWNGTLYFTAADATSGRELWKSDGTSGGTVLIKDIYAGISASSPSGFAALGTALYFAATDSSTTGVELWKTDGTAGGTVMVKDINPTANASSSPSLLTVAGSTLYFYATDGSSGFELWKTDGTTGGTVRVEDINAGSSSSAIFAMNTLGGVLLFGATDGVTGSELWRSDGTVAGTYRVADATPGNFNSSLTGITAFGSAVYFSAIDNVTGSELWKSDGSSLGTALVKDISSGSLSSSPVNFREMNGFLYFSASDATNGVELWKTDGSAAGTVLVSNISSGSASSSPTLLRAAGNTLFFAATDTTANGQELWKSDGTTTALVKNINPTTNASSSISGPVGVGSLLYFSANDGTNGSELWKSDGSDAGTVLVKNINPGLAASLPSQITQVGSTIFFSASDGVNGTELWKTDGTEAGTVMVKDIYPGSSSSGPSSLVAYNGKLYFYASDGVNLAELWTSDGTAGGTYMIKDINPGAFNSSVTNFREHNGILYFTASDSFGNELWRTDGTAGGTYLVKDIYPGSNSSAPSSLVSAGSYLYFAAATAANGTELWRTDGTAAGTQLVSDIVPGTSSSAPASLTLVGNRLIFTALVSGIGTELYSLDLAAAPEITLYEGADTSGPERQDNVGTYAFGTQTSSTTRSFTIKNTGAGYLFVSDIAVTGPQSASFVVLNKPDPSLAIQPGASHTFTVTATLEGPLSQSATLSVLSNDPDESSFDVPVTVVVEDLVPPVLTAPATYLIGQAGQLAVSLPDLRSIVAYTDNRPGEGSILQDPIPGDLVLAIGQTAVVTFTATDTAGNASNTVSTTVQMGLGQPNSGEVAWARSGGGVGAEGAASRVVSTSDGGALVAGAFGSSPFTLGSGADQVILTSAGSTDVFVAKFARDGALQWVRSGGGTTTDGVAGLLELPDGSVVVAGTFSASATFSGTTVTGGGSTDFFLIRYLSDGTLAWAKGVGGTGVDAVTQLVKLADGNLAVAGSYSTTSTLTLATGVTLTNIGSLYSDLFVIKYQASNGTALWARSIGGNSYNESSTGLNLAALPDGGLALAGGMMSSTLSITGSGTTLSNQGISTPDWFATKFDTSGNLLWARNAGGGTGSDTPSGLQAFSNGDLALAGSFNSTSATFGAGSTSPQTFANLGSSDVVVARLSGADGLQVWAKRAGGTGTDTLSSLLVMPDNSVILAGSFTNGAMQLGVNETHQTTLTAPTSSAKVVVALLAGGDGSLRWAKTTGGLATDAVSGIALLGNGDPGVVGTFTTPSEIFGPGETGETTLINAGTGPDVFLIKLSRSTGDLIWAKSGGGANTDSVHAFTALANGSAVVVGTFQPASATFGAGEPGAVTFANADSSGTNTDLFFARFHGGGVEAPVAPLVTPLAPSGLSPSSLTFNARIDSRGQDTTVLVEYGSTTSYGTSVPLNTVYAGLGTETRSLTLTGLAPLTTLNFRLVATNPAGTTTSANQVISTYPDAEIDIQQPAGTPLLDGASTVSFGAIPLGSSDTRTFTIRNTGTTGTLSGLALSIEGGAAADFALGTLSVSTLAPGDSTLFTVTYTPSAAGTRTATLHIASNDGDENPFDIALAGDNYLQVNFAAAGDVPIVANGYTVPSGRSLGLVLGFAPAPGCSLKVVDNTSANPISGSFVGLPHNGLIVSAFGGQTYVFQATYTGGDGNDLVLMETCEWTFLKGNTTATVTTNFGTQGVPAAANLPPGRSSAMSWRDGSGNLWLFGGVNTSGAQINDLWKYDPTTGYWTWMKGSNGSLAVGVYGTQGTGAAANTPGARQGAATWTDTQGKLWLFGGFGYNTTSIGYLADLWNYDPATTNWTWVGGSSALNVNGTYGTQGTGSASNLPGARFQSVTWIDASGTLWLFGGYGYPATGTAVDRLCDLWKYDPSIGNWTWVKGYSGLYYYGTYGTKGAPASSNLPGCRSAAVSWVDLQGKFWLFGGFGYGSSLYGTIGDLWRFDPTTNEWTWMHGSGAAGAINGSFGTKGLAAASNAPSYRQSAAGWTDSRGRLWLYGGAGYGALGSSAAGLNDLWVFDVDSNVWTWIKGPNTVQANGVYGTPGVASVANLPGARDSASTFTGNGPSPDPWLFGGLAYPSSGTSATRGNDLWSMDLPTQSTVTTAAASSVTAMGARLNASVTANSLPTGLRFRYGTSPDLAGALVTALQTLSSTATAGSADLTGLNYSTTFYYRAEVMNDLGTATGMTFSFTTQPASDIALERPAGANLPNGAATVDVGGALIGASVSQTFTLRNTGTATLTLSGGTIDGANGGDFVLGTLPATLAVGGSTTFTVTLTPAALGVRMATLHITSNDPDESPFDVNLTGSGLTVVDVWREQYFGSASNTGNAADTADPDGDGIANLMEYALGADPAARSTNVLPASGNEVKPADGKAYFTFAYRRRIVAGPLTYQLQGSSDLTSWTPVPGVNLEQTGAPVPTGDGITETVTFRVLPAIDDSPQPRFIRLGVSY